MTCGGCSLFGNKLGGAPSPRVKITDECKRLGKPVNDPSAAEGEDAFVVAAKHRAALVAANDKIVARDKCETRVRAGYAKGG